MTAHAVHPANGAARKRSHFSRTHLLAKVAERRCNELHDLPAIARIGNVACGPCWEHAIRTDERFVTEHELDPIDPYAAAAALDEVAVERACSGARVSLTRAERAEVARRLQAVAR